jgi:capsular polysaccharide biosynthesis protein
MKKEMKDAIIGLILGVFGGMILVVILEWLIEREKR